MGSIASAGKDARSREWVRKELVARVRARRAELEGAILARIRAGTASEADEADAEYAAGLRMAVSAAVEHGLTVLERGEEAPEAAPIEGIAQAQRAARTGVSVDTVVRRYVLGSSLIGDFLMQEATDGVFAEHGETMREMLGALSGVLDRMLRAITDSYNDELERAGRSPERRRAERVQRLLAGGDGDAPELGYELECWHIAAIAMGPGATPALRRVAAETGARLLCLPRGDAAVWAWFGAQGAIGADDVERALAAAPDAGEVLLTLGEPGHGLAGWRITHLQAQAAMRVALRSRRPVTRYADVALIASVLRDDALARSLIEIYLSPLGDPANGGAALRETLRAYFAAERNASSAASALGVTRHTVQNRLRAIEEKLGQTLHTRQAELEVALRLERLQADG